MPPQTPESGDDTSSLERLRQKLYVPGTVESFPEPSLGSNAPVDAQPLGWQEPESRPIVQKPAPRFSKAALFLMVAGGFFILAVMAAAYFLVFGSRSVSTDRVIITPDGPSAISSGDTVSLLISVQNQNPVPITSTMLSVDFPDTARDADSPEKPMSHVSDTIGDIQAGATGERSVHVILSGAENERILLPIRFEYRVEGSNAVFVKEATYEVTITSSPLSIRAETVSEAQAGQPLTFAVKVRSNAKTPLELVAVKLDPIPFGFSLTAGQKPLIPVGTLLPGEEKTVTLTGMLAAEDAEQRVFHFVAGTMASADATVIAVQYAKTDRPVSLAKPFLSTALSINRDSGETPTIAAAAPVQGIVTWVNTLSSQIADGQISLKLSGNALDPYSVSTNGGFYRSSDTTIIYTRENADGLARLDPGATGTASFTFSSKSAQSLIGVSQPSITATISVAGRRSGESNVPETISSTLTRTIQVGTDLTLATRSLRTIGAFKNTGPWPPVADQESTYTIQFALSNTVNSVGDTAVTAVLPSYVRFTGATSPSDGSIIYNESSRTVTWNAGTVPVGAGNTVPVKLASFQVVLLPSVSQRGTSPVLLFTQNVTGVDRFTKKTLSSTRPEVTAQTVTDPAYQSGFGEVK